MSLDGFLELIKQGKPVEGESLDKIFSAKKAIAISSFDVWTLENEIEDEDGPDLSNAPTTGNGPLRPRGKPNTDEKKKCPIFFKVTKEVDASSPELFLGYCRHADLQISEAYDSAKVTIRKAGGPNPVVYLVMEFGKVYVCSYSVNTDESKLPTETVSFSCRSAKMQYRPQKSKGFGSARITGWDFELESDLTE